MTAEMTRPHDSTIASAAPGADSGRSSMPDAGERLRVEDQRDDGVEDSLDEARDDRRECGADDDGDGEVDHVAAKDELLEALQHGYSLLVRRPPERRPERRRAPDSTASPRTRRAAPDEPHCR